LPNLDHLRSGELPVSYRWRHLFGLRNHQGEFIINII